MSPDEVARWLARARWRTGPQVDAAGLATRLAAALARAPEPLKAGRRKTLFALALSGSAPDHLLKVVRHRGRSLARRLGPGDAALELARATTCAARGIPTPLPVAAGTVRRRGLLEATLLLVPIVPGAIDGARLWDGGRAPRARRRAAASALGVLARALHEAGIDQDDLAPNNVLWRDEPAPRLLAIDFERVRIRRRPVAPARRALALARLDRHLAGASRGDRLRVLRGYAGGEARAWWRAVAQAHASLAQRDLAHLRRTATRASRRFAPVALVGVTGWARRDAPLDAACAALDAPHAAALWVTPLGPLDAPAAADAWAAALVLTQRGAAPPAVAMLCRGGGAFLIAERAAGAQPLADAPPERARAALVGLLDRLLAFGFDPDALRRDALLLAPAPGGGLHAQLRDPRGLRPGRPVAAPGGTRAWARRVLGEEGAAG